MVSAAIAAHKRGDNDSEEDNQPGECEDVRVTEPTCNDAPPEGGVTLNQAQTKVIEDYLTATKTTCITAHNMLKQAARVFEEQAKQIDLATDRMRNIINKV